MIDKLIYSLLFLLSGVFAWGQTWSTLPNQEEELGLIHWFRSYQEALEQAQKNGKPLFILFQEVPGCSTCKNYGNDLLTHPHIVEAIETYFTPLAIHNNKGGKDAEILRKFDEPSWNNPVVRIIDASTEKDISNRLNGRYDMVSLIETISNGMLISQRLIPTYLELLRQEYATIDLRETHLAMFCFWSGEKHLGRLDGVLATKAGYMNGSEVVKVKYDANILDELDLIQFASEKKCADAVYSNDQRGIAAARKLKLKIGPERAFTKDKESKYYTFNTDYKYLPMTHLQAIKVNAAIANGYAPEDYLSPRQLEIFRQLKSLKENKRIAIDQDFTTQWNNLLLEIKKAN